MISTGIRSLELLASLWNGEHPTWFLASFCSPEQSLRIFLQQTQPDRCACLPGIHEIAGQVVSARRMMVVSLSQQMVCPGGGTGASLWNGMAGGTTPHRGIC